MKSVSPEIKELSNKRDRTRSSSDNSAGSHLVRIKSEIKLARKADEMKR